MISSFPTILPVLQPVQQANPLSLRTYCAFCDQMLIKGDTALSTWACLDCLGTLPYIPMNQQQGDILSVFYYEAPINGLILAAKSGRKLHHLQLLAELTSDYLWRNVGYQPTAIIPVPLHPKKLRQRGFNQSLELIRPFSQRKQIPLALNAVIRARDTRPQKSLDAAQRQTNVAHAFCVKQRIQDQHLVVFDDVSTTGATCHSLQKTLYRQGAAQVKIWTCATTKQ